MSDEILNTDDVREYHNPEEMLDELNKEGMFTLSTGRKIPVELVEENDDHTLMKFELIDNETYNGVYFSKEAIEHQHAEFHKREFTVSHGMDHSRKTLEQLGEVTDMTLKYEGKDKVRAFITSKIYKETDAQQQAHILLGQELLNYISGGWSGKFAYDFDKSRFEIVKPLFRESSSTPTPAKRDATVQNALDVILSLTESINLEESNMSDKEETQEITEPSQEGEEVVEQDAELTTLKKEMKAELDAMKAQTEEYKKATADVKANLEQSQKVSLLERAKELGLPEEQFEGKTSEEIKFALEVANKVKMETLRERDPSIVFGGEGNVGLVDGSDEMVAKLEKEFFDWGDLEDDTLEGL